MRVQWRWVVLWSLWAMRALPPRGAPLRLAQGSLRGVLAADGSHYQYLGIPFATSTRFQAPGPPPRWEGELQAVEEHVRCPQLWGPNLVLGLENCLVLNVYSPVEASSERPLPVMVFIHGGGFKEGSGSRLLYGPDYLVARGVLLVTFNYRLGVLGFLCLGVRGASGNAGLKDQVAALRWVRDNIRAFGGDSENITIFGESAGAASVSYHLVSPLSRGLFHRAVLQSGSSTAPWASQRQPRGLARQLARSLGHALSDPHRLLQLFSNQTVYNLLTAEIPETRGGLKFTHLPFVPCVEREIEGEEPFITDAPFEAFAQGKHAAVPVIIGSNDEEGFYFAAFEDERSLAELQWERALPLDLQFPSGAARDEATRSLRALYGGERTGPRDLLGLSRLHGDPFFTFPALVESELLLRSGAAPVYTYLFSHAGWRNFPKLISGPTFWGVGGATHADELFYLFSLFPTLRLFENRLIDSMTLLWTNFAKYGDPSAEPGVQWSPGAAPALLGAAPGAEPLRSLEDLRPEHMRFWRRLYEKYRAPAVTALH